jgi:uncharacterized protein YaaR (DUF327 family)
MSYEQATAYMKMATACKEEVLSIFRKLDMEYLKLLEQLEQAQERIAELEMKYENTGAVFNRQYMQEKIERYEKVLKEIESLTKHANYSTASENSYRAFLDTANHIAKEALEGTE